MERHPIIGDARGLGMMFGFEFVKDRASKEPFEPERRLSLAFEQEALRRGLITYPCTGTVDGTLGDMMLMAPPLTMTATQMDELLSILDASLYPIEEEFEVRDA